jgi:hypothetical protein
MVPEVTVWLGPALATGATLAVPPLLLLLLLLPLPLPPPPPLQATSNRAAMPTRVRPGVVWRIPSYTGERCGRGVQRRLDTASESLSSPGMCAWSRRLILRVPDSCPFRISPNLGAKRAPCASLPIARFKTWWR